MTAASVSENHFGPTSMYETGCTRHTARIASTRSAGTPVLSCLGVPLSWVLPIGLGYSLARTRVPPAGTGVPGTRYERPWEEPGTGVPTSGGQTENINLPHPSDAGSKNVEFLYIDDESVIFGSVSWVNMNARTGLMTFM